MRDNACMKTPVIIDAGTGTCKAGFAGDKLPRTVFPTNLEHDQRKDSISRNASNRESNRRSIRSRRTITRGAIRNILKRVYHDELHIDPTEHPVLFVDSPINSEKLRKDILEVLFKEFDVPASCLCLQPILSLHSQGHTTGIVIDSGHGSTYIAPVYEGKILQPAVTQVPVAGRELDNSLALLLRNRGYAFDSSQEQTALREIKEKHCYISLNPDKELETSTNRFFVEKRAELPGGEIITLQTEMFRCPEALFKPSDAEVNDGGLLTAFSHSLAQVPQEIRQKLGPNIFLSGGSTMFNGFGQRLSTAIAESAPIGTKFNVVEPPDRQYSAWIGGSMLAKTDGFHRCLVYKEDYDKRDNPAEALCPGPS